MTPVKGVRRATEEDKLIGPGRHTEWRKTIDEIIEFLDNDEDAILEFLLKEGQRVTDVQSAIIFKLKRRGYRVRVNRLEPRDEQSENEIGFRISRKESE